MGFESKGFQIMNIQYFFQMKEVRETLEVLDSALQAAIPNTIFSKELNRRIEKLSSPVLEDGIIAALSDTFCEKNGKKTLAALIILESVFLKFPEKFAPKIAQKAFQDAFLNVFARRRTLGIAATMLYTDTQTWNNIEERGSQIFSRWFEMFMMYEEEYFFLLENYRLLRKEGAIIMKKNEQRPGLKPIIRKADHIVAFHQNSPDKCKGEDFVKQSQQALQELYSGFKAKAYSDEQEKTYIQSLYKKLKKIVKDASQFIKGKAEEINEEKFLQDKYDKLGGQSPTRIKDPQNFMEEGGYSQQQNKGNQKGDIDLLNLIPMKDEDKKVEEFSLL